MEIAGLLTIQLNFFKKYIMHDLFLILFQLKLKTLNKIALKIL